MDEGRIVETGTHEELLAAHGAYRALYMTQFRGEDTEAVEMDAARRMASENGTEDTNAGTAELGTADLDVPQDSDAPSGTEAGM
jgi:hypothetical protein